MRNILERLKENRQVEVAKEILESAGYEIMKEEVQEPGGPIKVITNLTFNQITALDDSISFILVREGTYCIYESSEWSSEMNIRLIYYESADLDYLYDIYDPSRYYDIYIPKRDRLEYLDKVIEDLDRLGVSYEIV